MDVLFEVRNPMKVLTAVVTLFVLVLASQTLSAQEVAQEIPQPSTVTKEHKWLKQFVGVWDVVAESPAGEGQPPIEGKAMMKSSMLGQLWVVNSSEHEVGGVKMKSIQMIGYDTQKKKYVGIWADSLVNHMWRYEGTVDESGKRLNLNATGPSMTGDGKMVNYRDSYEFKDKDTIIARSEMQDANKKWVMIMEGQAKRRK